MDKKIKNKKIFSFCVSVALILSLTIMPAENVSADERQVLVSGEAIGVTIMNDGILITEVVKVVSDGKTFYPSADAGLRPGDVIKTLDGVKPESAGMLSDIVSASKGKAIQVCFQRDTKEMTASVTPVFDSASGDYKVGLMVKDSASGIGTLTFVDPDNNYFAALGHPINDTSSGKAYSVLKGNIYKASISGSKKGTPGEPGELEGTFSVSFPSGVCIENNEFGIYGTLSSPEIFKAELMPVATQDEIKTGDAVIVSTVDENGPQQYSVKITKITRQGKPSPKGLVIEVTDEKLIGKTGGIVQGMSGSPIIQNGKLVGAVTHVIVSDPKKGYGIFAEWMLDEALENAA